MESELAELANGKKSIVLRIFDIHIVWEQYVFYNISITNVCSMQWIGLRVL